MPYADPKIFFLTTSYMHGKIEHEYKEKETPNKANGMTEYQSGKVYVPFGRKAKNKWLIINITQVRTIKILLLLSLSTKYPKNGVVIIEVRYGIVISCPASIEVNPNLSI